VGEALAVADEESDEREDEEEGDTDDDDVSDSSDDYPYACPRSPRPSLTLTDYISHIALPR
jgi:hypothetical protein